MPPGAKATIKADRAAKAVAQWRRERPDLDVGPMELLGRLNEAANRVSRGRQAPVMAGFGLQPGEFDVLATLRRSGAPHALTPTELYESTMVTSGAMTNRLDRLEQAALIVRRPNPADRRGLLIELTPKGKDLIDRAVTTHVAGQHETVAGLTQQERQALSALLAKLIATLPA